jgi:glycine cleavage system H lipoate-binding protein
MSCVWSEAVYYGDLNMSLLLVLITLAVFIAIDLAKSTKKRAILERSTHIDSRHRVQSADRYYHPGHSWVVVNSSSEVTIGVDDFAQKVIGHLSNIQLPEAGTKVQQGQTYATLRRGDKSLQQVAPLSGLITAVNKQVCKNPTLVNASPFDRGWIVKIAPSNLALECRNLLRGISATQWEEAVRNQLNHWFSPSLHPVLQDGGMIIDNVSDLMGDEDWQDFVKDFFPVSETPDNDKQTKN